MANLKIPNKTLADNFNLQDFKDDFTALNTETTDWTNFKANGGTIGGNISAPNIHTPRGSIATGVDANKLITPGVYQVTPGVTNINNIGYGLLTVEYSGGYYKQTLSDLGATRETFIRQSGDGGSSWSGWFGDGRGVYNNGTNGYTKIPNGFIEQWGIFDSNGMNANQMYTPIVTLPIAFPSKFLGVSITVLNTVDSSGTVLTEFINPPGYQIYTMSTFALRLKSSVYISGGCRIFWRAIGY